MSAKVREDWYQTESAVVIEIFLKNQNPDDVKVSFEATRISVDVKDKYSAVFNLLHAINPDESSYKVMSTKIEVKLKKVDGTLWSSLRRDQSSGGDKPEPSMRGVAAAGPATLGSPYKVNWDRVVDDMTKEDKAEGEEAVNDLFRKIYADSTDDVRRAMMKSFVESGGTVLSTNWNEVGKAKVEVKPPDGCEYKKWD